MARCQFMLLAALITILPAVAQESASEMLAKSPRHQEWVAVKQGERQVHSFVVYPETEKKAGAVIVIHENRGLNDWVCSVADRLAEAGFIAIAPDLLSGMGPDGGKTSDFPDRNAARDAIYRLEQEQVTSDLIAVAEYVEKLPSANGEVYVAGFCWGGSQTFQFATNRRSLKAAFVFYGRAPDRDALVRINCPVYGFYGGNDARVTATVPGTVALMKELGKTYMPETYEGAGHGFMRSGSEPGANEANMKAMQAGWKRWISIISKQ